MLVKLFWTSPFHPHPLSHFQKRCYVPGGNQFSFFINYKIYFFGDCSHRMWLFWCTIWWFKGRSCIAWLRLLSSYIYDFVVLVGIAFNLLRTCPMIRYKRFCHLLTWCSWSKAVYVNFTIGKKMWLKWIRDLNFFVMKYI